MRKGNNVEEVKEVNNNNNEEMVEVKRYLVALIDTDDVVFEDYKDYEKAKYEIIYESEIEDELAKGGHTYKCVTNMFKEVEKLDESVLLERLEEVDKFGIGNCESKEEILEYIYMLQNTRDDDDAANAFPYMLSVRELAEDFCTCNLEDKEEVKKSDLHVRTFWKYYVDEIEEIVETEVLEGNVYGSNMKAVTKEGVEFNFYESNYNEFGIGIDEEMKEKLGLV